MTKETLNKNQDTLIVPNIEMKDRVCALIDAGIQLTPFIGGTLSTLVKQFFELPYDKKTNTWRSDVTSLINEIKLGLEGIDSSSENRLSNEALQLLQVLIVDCPNGLGEERYSIGNLYERLPNFQEERVRETAYELVSFGLLKDCSSLTTWKFRLSKLSYKEFDSIFTPWNTAYDVKNLARELLSSNSLESSDICSQLGWQKRRFNPAMQIIIDEMPDNCLRDMNQWEYSIFALNECAQTRAILQIIQN